MFLNLTLTPKIAPKGPKSSPERAKKSAKEAQNVAGLKTKDRAVLPKPGLVVYIDSQKSFEPDLDPKNGPKGPKK